MTNSQALPERLIIYDGHCVICNASVRIISSKDKTDSIKFTHTETAFGSELSGKLPLNINPDASVVFMEAGKVHSLSDAAIEIAKYLKFPYNLLRFFKILPKGFRDKLYRLVANNRYRIFKRREQCILPGPKLRSKIVE